MSPTGQLKAAMAQLRAAAADKSIGSNNTGRYVTLGKRGFYYDFYCLRDPLPLSSPRFKYKDIFLLFVPTQIYLDLHVLLY